MAEALARTTKKINIGDKYEREKSLKTHTVERRSRGSLAGTLTIRRAGPKQLIFIHLFFCCHIIPEK